MQPNSTLLLLPSGAGHPSKNKTAAPHLEKPLHKDAMVDGMKSQRDQGKSEGSKFKSLYKAINVVSVPKQVLILD